MINNLPYFYVYFYILQWVFVGSFFKRWRHPVGTFQARKFQQQVKEILGKTSLHKGILK